MSYEARWKALHDRIGELLPANTRAEQRELDRLTVELEQLELEHEPPPSRERRSPREIVVSVLELRGVPWREIDADLGGVRIADVVAGRTEIDRKLAGKLARVLGIDEALLVRRRVA